MTTLLREIRQNPLLWLLLFVPVVFITGKVWPEAHTLLFGLSVLAIVPLATLLSHATESVAAKTGDAVGGLLNATLGNLQRGCHQNALCGAYRKPDLSGKLRNRQFCRISIKLLQMRLIPPRPAWGGFFHGLREFQCCEARGRFLDGLIFDLLLDLFLDHDLPTLDPFENRKELVEFIEPFTY